MSTSTGTTQLSRATFANADRQGECDRCDDQAGLYELTLMGSPYSWLCASCLASLSPERDREVVMGRGIDSDDELLRLIEAEIARDGGPRRSVVGALNRERQRATENFDS